MSNVPLPHDPREEQSRRKAKGVAVTALAAVVILVGVALSLILTAPADSDAPSPAIIALALSGILFVVGLIAASRGWGTRTIPPGVAAGRAARGE